MALSYTWGEARTPVLAQIDGTDVNVQPSLVEILEKVRFLELAGLRKVLFIPGCGVPTERNRMCNIDLLVMRTSLERWRFRFTSTMIQLL